MVIKIIPEISEIIYMVGFKSGIPATVLFLTVLSVFLNYNSSGAVGRMVEGKAVDSIINLENAIIVHGLHSEISEHDEISKKGGIIVDNDFGNGLATPRGKKNGIVKRNDTSYRNADVDLHNPTAKEYLKNLRKKDIRWQVMKYRIRRGDNLWDLARSFNSESEHIIGINAIDNPDRLDAGKTIIIPHRKGTSYTVKKGDTLSAIAKEHGTTVSSLKSFNTLRNAESIMPGKTLFIAYNGKNNRIKKEAYIAKNEPTTKPDKEKRFQWPLRGRITSSFGNRIDPFSKKRSFHCGIDISAEPGTPVRASAAGKVIFNGWKDGYGNMLVLRHDGGYITVYAHNKKNTAEVDTIVGKNEIIAYSGMTGAVTGAHLHFEIRKYLTPLNPLRFIK